MSGIDKLIDEVITLRGLVGKLAAEVTRLRDQADARDSEVATLTAMLREWPVQHPIVPARLH